MRWATQPLWTWKISFFSECINFLFKKCNKYTSWIRVISSNARITPNILFYVPLNIWPRQLVSGLINRNFLSCPLQFHLKNQTISKIRFIWHPAFLYTRTHKEKVKFKMEKSMRMREQFKSVKFSCKRISPDV